MFTGKHDGMDKAVVIGIPIDTIAIGRLYRSHKGSKEKK
jgi:hypothetical protein